MNDADFSPPNRDKRIVQTIAALWPFGSAERESDDALLKRVQRGDRVAFDLLRRRHEPTVRRWVLHRVPNGMVDDVVQDVWLACWQSLPRYAGRARFTTWLHRIVLNKCADCCRRAPVGEVLQDDVLDEPAIEELAYRKIDLQDALRDLMVDLNESQREVIELYYGGGLTLQEIADALNRNLSTVKQQFYRGHERVARRMKERGLMP